MRVQIIGRGRVGQALAARLQERDSLTDRDPDVVLLCVPDAAIAGVARTVLPGPWVAHVSGATPLASLAPHERRFTLHPLQTFTKSRGAEQIDGAWAGGSGETEEARRMAQELAAILGLRYFDLADDHRAIYHAGAVMASNFVVTLHHAAARAVAAAGAPSEALIPLMIRTIENDFALTGPISRGDWGTVTAHLDALARELPDLEPLYRTLTEATRTDEGRTHRP